MYWEGNANTPLSVTPLLNVPYFCHPEIIPANIFTVNENKSGDSDLGNGNSNFQINNSENDLSKKGNGNFQTNNSPDLLSAGDLFDDNGTG